MYTSDIIAVSMVGLNTNRDICARNTTRMRSEGLGHATRVLQTFISVSVASYDAPQNAFLNVL